MKRVFLSLLFSVFLFTSCRLQQSTDQVTISYHLETKLVLDVDGKHLDELLQAMEASKVSHVINGHVAHVRPSNETNLNGYSIKVQKKDGQRNLHFLHNNFPFSISQGKKLIYNFKHLLSEKDVRLLYVLIPAWENDKS